MNKLNPDSFLLFMQNPKSKAIISSSVNYTFEEFKQIVLNTASYFQDRNISSGDRIAIYGQNDIDYVVNILALWQISAVPVPLNTRLNESELDELIKFANCSHVLARKDFAGQLKSIHEKIIEYPFEIRTNHNFSGSKNINSEDPAVIIFTSGSTSKSKGIILSYKSLFNSALNSNQLLRYTHSDRWLASLPFYHVGGFSIISRALVFRIPLIMPDSLSIDDLINAINKYQPTFISLVAAQLKIIVDEGIRPNPELKNCLIGGGFSEIEILKSAYELGWPVNVVYGSTETSSFVTALLKDELIIKPNSVGRAVPTNKIQIVDDEGNELKPFEVGEVTVQSNAFMLDYLNSDETSEVIKDGFYNTGDIGFIDDDGYLFIHGRKNYLISSGGENVNPVEVEKALLMQPSISEAVVFPLKDKHWGEIIAAAVVLKKGSSELTYEEIKLFLLENLSGFKIPKRIFFESQLPKTELGKIQKNKLIERYKFTSL